MKIPRFLVIIKKNKLYKIIHRLKYQIATLISPTLNTKMRYRKVFGEKINLKDPKTFNEKLLWLKLNRYANNDLVIRCTDKYLVRDYVRACGYDDILNELIGVWESSVEIPWEDLPNEFVLKLNHGAGMNILCPNKRLLDKESVCKQLDKWKKHKCWLSYSEMQYKYIKKRIICEKFLKQEDRNVITDYKVYCFNGQPKAILVMNDRGTGTLKREFFDIRWNKLTAFNQFIEPDTPTEKPKRLDYLLEIATSLSKPFEFVRCDFYIIENRIYFGELTFTPAGGLHTAQTIVDGKEMGELIQL